MMIVSQDRTAIVNSKNVLSFSTKDDSRGAYLVASRGIETSSVVIGDYKTLPEAKKALQRLFSVLVSESKTGQTSYQIE